MFLQKKKKAKPAVLLMARKSCAKVGQFFFCRLSISFPIFLFFPKLRCHNMLLRPTGQPLYCHWLCEHLSIPAHRVGQGQGDWWAGGHQPGGGD